MNTVSIPLGPTVKDSLDEQVMIDSSHNFDLSSCLFTIEYEGLTIDSYINKLIYHNIVIIIDVRRNPISMKFGFSKIRLRHYLERVGITYTHIPELGIESSMRKNLNTKKDYDSLLTKYGTRLTTCEDKLYTIHVHLNLHKRVALTCFEAEASACHRHKITEYLHSSPKGMSEGLFEDNQKNWNIPIVHIP